MLVQIAEIFTSAEAAEMRRRLEAAEWVDGRATAGHQSARVKQNRQLAESNPLAQELGGLIVQRLTRNPLFMAAALPRKIIPPLFNRYEGGENFGYHVDNAVRPITGTADRVRTDMSATLFLSEPDTYDGGELVVDDLYGPRSIKLAAGSMVLYPGTSLHRVSPVTRGARISAFFWLQSLVREDAQRTLLLELDVAIQRLTQDVKDHPSLVQLTGVYHNLLRRWVDV
ncbi:Fe2+-dependent dioxygenase [Bordetella bronchialis]|uniref:Fe2+-dependent dioxygenase n=1 Tax=Bordetella bronchialis TaxID=463025 RepID=A0A193FYE9_9BORD|nr:Fe2+-dependent dioxygenase [Bordetella bronchialis]ANN67690.1 Fe2+-dependent dioxygenase [Bordetella bronchialis]ANN72782.1 Fe2+-dependent dioxygenase [Bordetella bronchialis]